VYSKSQEKFRKEKNNLGSSCLSFSASLFCLAPAHRFYHKSIVKFSSTYYILVVIFITNPAHTLTHSRTIVSRMNHQSTLTSRSSFYFSGLSTSMSNL